jgi:hypothetical protein
MTEYVLKRRTTVRVSHAGNDPLEGQFCLTVDSAELRRAETLLDLLNSQRRMVPFIRTGDRRVSLLTRANIDWVMADEDAPRELVYPPHFALGFEESVRVGFLDGREIEGTLQVELSPTQSRVSDFMNGTVDFFPVVTRLGTLLANKGRVREMLLIESRAAIGEPRLDSVSGELPRPPR